MENKKTIPKRRLWVAVLCGYLALGATWQELPVYVVNKFGEGPFITGLVVSVAFLATALTRPFAGRAGDVGRARAVVLTGAALTTLAAFAHLFAPNIGWLIFARLLMGAGEAALFSGALPWVLSGTPANRRGRVVGWFGLSMWGGLAAGPLIAVLMHHLGGGSTAAWGAIMALPLISTGLVATTPRQIKASSIPPSRARPWRNFVPKGVGLPGLCLGLASYGYGSLSALLVLYLTTQHIGGEEIGLTIFALSFLLARSVGSPLIDRYGGVIVARVILLIEAAGLVLLSAITTESAALSGVAIAGVGIGLVYPSTAAITLQRQSHGLCPGAAMGIMTSFWDLGVLVAGPLGGLITTRFGYQSAFITAAGIAIAALAITFSLRVHKPLEASIPS